MEQGIVLESVWVAVGFVVFIALVWRKAGGAIATMLDQRSEKISSELREASALREAALEEREEDGVRQHLLERDLAAVKQAWCAGIR